MESDACFGVSPIGRVNLQRITTPVSLNGHIWLRRGRQYQVVKTLF